MSACPTPSPEAMRLRELQNETARLQQHMRNAQAWIASSSFENMQRAMEQLSAVLARKPPADPSEVRRAAKCVEAVWSVVDGQRDFALSQMERGE